MLLIVGLGNPGKEYEKTYHNLGFMALDFFAQEKGVSISKAKDKALMFEGIIDNKKVILLKPQTYMNLSGTSIIRAVNRFKIEPQNVLVIYDDVDLEEGKIRFRLSGSAGTHNGMKNTLENLKTQAVPRIRIGAGKQEKHNKNLADYVLSNIKNVDNYIDTFKEVTVLIDEFIKNNGAIENKSVK